jgi:hypothetical protein
MSSLEEQIEQLQLALERCKKLNRERQKRYRLSQREQKSNSNDIEAEEIASSADDESNRPNPNSYLLNKKKHISAEDIIQALNNYPHLAEKTRESYASHFRAIHRMFKYSNYLTGLQNVNQNIDILNSSKYKYNSKKSYVQLILIIFDKLRLPTTKLIHDKYGDYNSIMAIENIDRVAREKKELTYIPYSEFIELVKQHYAEDSMQYLYVMMMDDITCRDDLYDLIVCNDMDQVDLNNKNENYLYVPPLTQQTKKSKAKIFINKYKTTRIYGPYQGEYSVKTTNLIRNYLNGYKIIYGQHGLFGRTPLSRTAGEILTKVGLKKKGQHLPKTDDNLPGAIGVFRKMKTSEYVANKSPEERLELSKRMMHSLVIQNTVYNMNLR